ncbi:MAG: hypothetical protein R3F65_27395 [bacterium]
MRWAALALVAAAGCGPSPEEAVAGRWVVDVEVWLADPALAESAPAARAAVEALGRAMVAETVFEIGDGRCARVVAGRAEPQRCRFEREDRGVVVLRATRPDGTTHFVRARPGEGVMSLTWEGQTLPVRRMAGSAATK